MKIHRAVSDLSYWDRQGRCVFTLADIQAVMDEKNLSTLKSGVARLVGSGVLVRAALNVYVNPRAASFDPARVIENIATTLRRGEYNYVSLESALSEYGVISQIPMQLTVMTTGRSGFFTTPWGSIEFTHTARSREEVAEMRLEREGHALCIAPLEVALRDQRRVGRNLDMIDNDVVEELLRDAQAEPVFQPGF